MLPCCARSLLEARPDVGRDLPLYVSLGAVDVLKVVVMISPSALRDVPDKARW
jgi:uncharacterized protein (DUF302 family)